MRTSAMILLLAVMGLGGQPATAADCGSDTSATSCCSRCGRHAACVDTTCQVVCEMKKETKTCWCVECQEICPLMPGCHERCGCHDGCKQCAPGPRCGHPKCVKKLVKKEYQVETPVYKCVVQHLCPDCCNGEATSEVPTVAPPKAPAERANPPMAPAPSAPVRAPKAK
jgi:hypothetical protein